MKIMHYNTVISYDVKLLSTNNSLKLKYSNWLIIIMKTNKQLLCGEWLGNSLPITNDANITERETLIHDVFLSNRRCKFFCSLYDRN